MSISPPTTTAAVQHHHHHTYWCHECDMSIHLPSPPPSIPSTTTPTTIPPLCPHCHRDFLELMDYFTPPPMSPLLRPFLTLGRDPTTTPPFPLPSTARSDDNFLLDSPYLQRLIHHLMSTNNNNSNPNPNPPHFNSPASKSAIESLDHVKIDMVFLQNDPTIVCPVCKDHFVIDSEAKLLPCKHIYHSDCIIPWLEMNNSCPVCRFKLQSHDEIEAEDRENNYSGPPRLDELLDDEEDLFVFRNTLSNVVRRHQLSGRNWIGERGFIDDEVLFSPSQIGEAEGGGSRVAAGGRIWNHVERADSVETVSSWPRGPVEGSGSGDGEIGVGVSNTTSSSRGVDDLENVKA